MTADTGGGLYLEPALYDLVNTPDTAREVRALVRAAGRFAARSGPRSRWLEPACGTGRYLRLLARRGREVTGYDPAAPMRAYAARRLPAAAVLDAHFTTGAAALRASLGNRAPVDVAICPVNSLRHLPDDASLLAHLTQIAGVLAPEGVYVVGLDLHHEGREPDEDVWEAARGRLRARQVIQYLPPEGADRTETVIVALMITRPRGVEHRQYAYPLRTYTHAQWSHVVDRSPLRRLAVCDAAGQPVPDLARHASLPYQLEILAPR